MQFSKLKKIYIYFEVKKYIYIQAKYFWFSKYNCRVNMLNLFLNDWFMFLLVNI